MNQMYLSYKTTKKKINPFTRYSYSYILKTSNLYAELKYSFYKNYSVSNFNARIFEINSIPRNLSSAYLKDEKKHI